MTENGHERISHVVTEFFCVTIEGRGCKELYVAIGFFRVATKRCVGMWKLGRDRV